MSFSWPWALLALLVIPLVFAIWWLTRRRRRRAVVRVTSIALVRTAVPGRSRWRRRIPAALLTLGLAVLAVGAARPQATVPVASSSATIMLTLDVSGSMCSTDVKPNRITAAEQTASAFIKSQAGGPRIGLVAFAATAVVLVPPTTDTQQLLGALGGLTTSFGTAIGEGILTSLDAIAQVDPSVAPTGATVSRDRGAGYADDVIVVLTDGSNNRGVDPQTAAKEAANRGVRVFTIGYGTDNLAPLACSSTQFGGFAGGGFGGFGGQRGRVGNPFDVDYGALMQISRTTGGTFYRAQDADQLAAALAKLPAAFTVVRKHIDMAAWFAAGGGLLIAAAVALSLWWNRPRRMPVAPDRAAPPARLRALAMAPYCLLPSPTTRFALDARGHLVLFRLVGLDDVRGHCRGDGTAAKTRCHLVCDDRGREPPVVCLRPENSRRGGCAALAAGRAPGHEPHDDEDGYRDQPDNEKGLERCEDPACGREGKPDG